MLESGTQVQVPKGIIWRVVLTASYPSLIFAVLCLFFTVTVTVLGWVSGMLLVIVNGACILAAVLVAVAVTHDTKDIQARAGHWQLTDFGAIVYLDGTEQCMRQEDIDEYFSILQMLGQELGCGVHRHTVVVSVLGKRMPFLRVSRRLGCILVRWLDGSVAGFCWGKLAFLQQALGAYMNLLSTRMRQRFGAPVDRDDLFLLGQAMAFLASNRYTDYHWWVLSAQQSAQSSVAHIATSGASGHGFDLLMLLAFVGEQKGITSMIECRVRRNRHEAISLSHLVGLFGSLANLEQQWKDRIQNAAQTDPHAQSRQFISYLHSLMDAGALDEAVRVVEEFLGRYPHSISVVGTVALRCAVKARKADVAVALASALVSDTACSCCRSRFKLAQALLHHIAGDEEQAFEVINQLVEERQSPAFVHALAKRWVVDGRLTLSAKAAWRAVEEMTGVVVW